MRTIVTAIALTGGLLVAGATSAHGYHDYCAAVYFGIEDNRPLVNPYACVPGADLHPSERLCVYNVEPSTPDITVCFWLQDGS